MTKPTAEDKFSIEFSFLAPSKSEQQTLHQSTGSSSRISFFFPPQKNLFVPVNINRWLSSFLSKTETTLEVGPINHKTRILISYTWLYRTFLCLCRFRPGISRQCTLYWTTAKNSLKIVASSWLTCNNTAVDLYQLYCGTRLHSSGLFNLCQKKTGR